MTKCLDCLRRTEECLNAPCAPRFQRAHDRTNWTKKIFRFRKYTFSLERYEHIVYPLKPDGHEGYPI